MEALLNQVPSATFDESLVQRSGSGETDVSSNNSGLATPQDEDVQPLVIDMKQATRDLDICMNRSKEDYRVLHEGSYALELEARRVVEVPSVVVTRVLSSESNASLLESPEFEDPEVTHARAKAMYNMPNRHISIEVQGQKDEVSTTEDQLELEKQHELEMDSLSALFEGNWTVGRICKIVLRAALFLPWCIAVGGSIISCPKQLDGITFRAGFLEQLTGIHRFAHWADRASEHVVIFLTFIGFLIWLQPTVGISLACATTALCVNAWCDFRLDPTIPLGEDDQQSIYLSATQFWLTDEFLNIRRTERGYVLDKERGGVSCDAPDLGEVN